MIYAYIRVSTDKQTLENQKFAKALTDFIGDGELKQNIINNLKSSDFSKSDEINKLYKIIERSKV